MELQGFFTWEKLRHWTGCFLFTLFFLVVIIDPTDTILGLKSKTFVLLVAFNMIAYRPSFRFLPHILVVYFAVTVSHMLSVFQGNSPGVENVMATYISFTPLILLLWVHHYDLLKLTLFPAMVAAIVVCVIFVLCTNDERLEGIIYLFMTQHNHTIMMSHRYILGVEIFGVYYKSFVCLGMPLFWLYYTLYNSHTWKRRIALLLPVGIMTFAFLVSGTRATMLLPFYTIALVSYKQFAAMRTGKYFLYPLLAGFVLCFFLMLFMMASEKGESSNIIKFGHIVSYKELFDQHPIYLLLGQGPGTRFYSEGFHRLTTETEWTYLEIIRQYGLMGLLIMFTLLYPFYALWKHHSSSYFVGIMGAYLAYLMIAGTNPLLFSSTGMQIVLCIYSIVTLHDAQAPMGLNRIRKL